MAAIINTAHRVVAKHGIGPYGESLDGFTSGNLAGGIQPTELSEKWCDAVQQEINNAASQYKNFALNPDSYSDLAYALDQSHVSRRPINTTNVSFTLRTQTDSALSGTNGLQNLFRERTQYTSAAASGSVNNAGTLTLPTNCQAFVEFRGSVCQSDAMTTNYANFHYRASVRNAAGVVTIQDSGSAYTHMPGIAYTFLVTTTGANVIMRVSVPAVPAAKTHNIFVHTMVVNSTATS